MQTGHERYIFFSTTSSIQKKICQIFMVREPLRVTLLMFCLRPSTSNIYKTFKSPYISTETNKCSSDNIPRRYAFDWTNNGGHFNVQRSSFCNILNTEKSILNSDQEIEFLGLTVNSVKMTLSFPEQKIKRIQGQCQELYVKVFVMVLELTKLIGLLASTI